jgi:hypothetical protein
MPVRSPNPDTGDHHADSGAETDTGADTDTGTGTGTGTGTVKRADVDGQPLESITFRERLWGILDLPWLGGRRVAPWVLLAAAAVVGVSVVGGLYVQNHPARLGYGTLAFEIRPFEAELTFEVEKAPNAVAQCTVRARSRDNLVVGRSTDIVVGPAPNGQGSTTVTTVVDTTEEANVVEVEDCRIVRAG